MGGGDVLMSETLDFDKYWEEVHVNQAKRIKEILIDSRMSQKELAEKIGVSQVTVSRWVNGHNLPMRNVNLHKLKKLFPMYSMGYLSGSPDAPKFVSHGWW